jgi:hypothetical protein
VVDDTGKVRVVIDATGGVPGISLVDAQGSVRALIGLDLLGSPSLLLSDAAGKSKVGLGVVYGGANILFYNEKGEASMSVDTSGSPNITLKDANGFRMDLGSTGTVNFKTGATEQSSAASIIMFGNDEKHHTIWQAP